MLCKFTDCIGRTVEWMLTLVSPYPVIEVKSELQRPTN